MRLSNFFKRKNEKSAVPKSATVRYMYPVFFGFAIVMAAASILAPDASYIELVPSRELVMEGETFTIDVFAYAHVPVNALDVTIKFIPGSITILGVDQGESVLTIWTEEPKISNNSISFGGGTYRRGFLGRHRIGTINVAANVPGRTEFFISQAQLLAGDGSGTKVATALSIKEAKRSFIIYDKDADPAAISAEFQFKITADIDGDGKVTLKDISVFMSAWYSRTTVYDFNNDQKMNFVDFSIILARSFSQ